MSNWNMSHRKMADFVLFPLLGFTLVMKLRNFNFENNWNTLIIFFIKNTYDVRFEHVLWKMSDFVLVPLFGFTLVIKLRNFNFESHCNTVIFFDKKMMSDLIMSCQTVSDLVDKLHCLSRILAISWELQILIFFWNSLFLTVCCYHVTYVFHSESTLYSCLNVKELKTGTISEV